MRRQQGPWRGWLVLLAAMAGTGTARAQSAPANPHVDLGAGSIWTLQDENSSISANRPTDRYYTNGFRAGWTSGPGVVPDVLANAGRAVLGQGTQRVSIDISQSIYTPLHTELDPPSRYDRPYAGVLTATGALTEDTANTRTILGLSVGIIGPAAGAEAVQNSFHRIIGQGFDRAWGYQLRTEPVAELLAERIWRLPVAQFYGLELDALPAASAGLGTMRVYAQGGAQIRLGQGLGADFGVPRLTPSVGGGDAFENALPVAWYVFAGADGQAVAYDITLNGNMFQSSPRVGLEPVVGEMQVGLALLFRDNVRLTYTQMFQTAEFRGQHAGLFEYGSLALSVRF